MVLIGKLQQQKSTKKVLRTFPIRHLPLGTDELLLQWLSARYRASRYSCIHVASGMQHSRYHLRTWLTSPPPLSR